MIIYNQKKAILLTILFSIILVSGCISQKINTLEYRIIDQNGKPVANALVNLSITSPYVSFANGYTDINGTILFALPSYSIYHFTVRNPQDGQIYTTIDRVSSDMDEELIQPLVSITNTPTPTPIPAPKSKNPTICTPSSIEQGNLLVGAFRSVVVNPLFC